MSKLIGQYGILQGAFLFVAFFVSYLLFGDDPNNYASSELYGYSMMIISCIAIFYATKSFRDQHNQGALRFVDGIKIGIGISSIAGLLFALYNWVYLTWLNPGFLTDYQAWHEQQIRESGQTQEVIDQQLVELAQSSELMHSTAFMLVIMFLTVWFIGALFTLVTAAALKRTTSEDTL